MYSVKNVKTWNSREWGPNGAYSCTLYRDNKRVAKVTDWGDGAPPIYEWFDKGDKVTATIKNYQGNDFERVFTKEEKRYYDFLQTQTYYCDYQEKDVAWSEDGYPCHLVGEFEEERRMKRLCKNKTVIRCKENAEGEFYTFKTPFSNKMKQALQAKYGDNIVEFVNERYA